MREDDGEASAFSFCGELAFAAVGPGACRSAMGLGSPGGNLGGALALGQSAPGGALALGTWSLLSPVDKMHGLYLSGFLS